MVNPARSRLPADLDGLFKSQIVKAIDEANLGKADTQIATMYLVDRIPQIDIAIEIGMGRKAVGGRLKSIKPKVSQAVERIPQ